ncbi:MAG: PAS domain S-box protein [Bacteroidetes bacterium]|nr:PAS domain S-box protein [Bacteroidota bacterium]MCW5895543.1 PAS domain S-box protein [Bacteroidota bacterium]
MLTAGRRVAWICALLAAAIGGAAIAGWIWGSRALTSFDAHYIPMAPNTAIFFLLLGISTFLLWFPARINLLIIRLVGLFVVLLSFMRLCEFVFDFDIGVDRWIFAAPEAYFGLAPAGRMAFFTAVNFLFTGSSLIILSISGERHNLNNIAGVNTIVVVCLGAAFCTAYFLDAPLFYSEAIIPMALNTAISFFLLGMALFATVTVKDFSRQYETEKHLHISLDRKILAAFGLAFSTILIVSIIAYNSITKTLESARLEAHTHEVLAEVSALLSSIKDMENASRGYIITNEKELLVEYRASVLEITHYVDRIRSLTKDNPEQQKRIGTLDSLIQRRVEFANNTIQVFEAEGAAAARSMAREAMAVPAMIQLHEHVENIERAERLLLNLRADAQKRSSRNMVNVLSLLAVLVTCMLAAIYMVVHRDLTGRKQAEHALRQLNTYLEHRVQERTASLLQSEERYRHLFESNPLPLWVFATDTLAFLEVNNAATVNYGYSREEFLTMTIKDIRPEEEITRLINDVAQQHKGLDSAGVWKHRKKDGTLLDVEITSHEIRYAGRGAKLVLANDVTERTRAEERFRLVVEASPNGIVMVDPRGNIALVNSQTERMFGYPRSELLGKSIEILVPERNRDIHAQNRDGYLANPQARAMGVGRELYGLRKDGTEFPVEIGLSPIELSEGSMVLGSIVDITTRKLAEDALRKSEGRFRTTLDHMMEGCQIIGFDWRYLYVNEVAARQGKSTKEQLLGRTMMEMYPGIDKSPFFENLRRCVNDRVPLRMENEFTFPDGSKGWFNLSLEPVPEGTFILSEDITKQKQMDEELKRYRDRLEELVRERTAQLEMANKELEAFSYSVSHDLRSPLRHIDGFSEMLQKTASERLDEKSRRYLTIISESVKKMGTLIDELLVFSRMGRTEMRSSEVNIEVLVKEALIELQNEVNGRDISWTIGRFPEVVGDPSMLRLVFVNLLSNAIKYTRTRTQPRVEVGLMTDPNEHVFFVKDNGVGFDDRYAGKLFGVFQRLHADTEFEGTGIGLANVRRIVNRHGGRTWAEGTIDGGATFYFSLPLDRTVHRTT